MKLGIIGCGLIGNKRAAAKRDLQIVSAADAFFEKAKALTDKFGGKPSDKWQNVIDSDADIVVIAVPHNQLAIIALEAAKAGKHILIEKPAARRSDELLPLAKIVKEKNLKIKVGYNHRFHPSIQKAKEFIDNKVLGDLYFIRAFYGHGGRIGYEKEWRFQKKISGGGELLDQGSHLIDLSQWFLGKFTKIQGNIQNYFWGGEVEDNAFMLLNTNKNQTAFLHSAWTEWKNTFLFEITGKNAKIAINGLGGSYGTEQITLYKMLPQMGPPETTTWSFPFHDNSWQLEMDELINAIKENRQPIGGIDEAIETLKIIEQIYITNGVL
ncbi:MAG: Gfo/Idh/MocA family oxidoreductase [Elusimicrobiota bacterium]|jgi:predicted dehydrogenase|nr:Gfo/Idh/MocA family oxidoreductase [Elusimicrobiota bacterium]